jgi:hypothetical protein
MQKRLESGRGGAGGKGKPSSPGKRKTQRASGNLAHGSLRGGDVTTDHEKLVRSAPEAAAPTQEQLEKLQENLEQRLSTLQSIFEHRGWGVRDASVREFVSTPLPEGLRSSEWAVGQAVGQYVGDQVSSTCSIGVPPAGSAA